MANRLTPYLQFDGNAREAMTHYQSVFGGELELTTFGEFELEGPAEHIMHSSLSNDAGLALMGSDTPPGDTYSPTGNVGISLFGNDDAQLRREWEQLAEGATILMPLEKQMWGDVYGQCIDRFGIMWMVNIAAEQEG